MTEPYYTWEMCNFVGFNRLHLENFADESDTSAQWSGRRAPGAMNDVSVFHAFWRGGEPDVTSGACVREKYDATQVYDVSWEFVDCDVTEQFVCETMAGLQGVKHALFTIPHQSYHQSTLLIIAFRFFPVCKRKLHPERDLRWRRRLW